MIMDNDEILRIAAMYIGAPIRFFNPVTKEWGKYRKMTPSDLILVRNVQMQWQISLTSLYNITDDHALEFAKWQMHKSVWTSKVGKGRLLLELQEAEMNDGYKYGPLSYKEHQQLILWGYAVPLWFGIGHWANGKTAIDLGIATLSTNEINTIEL